jgi:DNA-binding MarR family transcriptional regulator
MLLLDAQEPPQVDLSKVANSLFEDHYYSLLSDTYPNTHSDFKFIECHDLAQNHTLIQGPQGSGKTKLLKQIQQDLLAKESGIEEYKHLAVIRLNEHEYGIRTIRDLCHCLSEHLVAREQGHFLLLQPSNQNAIQDSPSNHWSAFIEQFIKTQTLLFIMIDNADCLLKQLDKVDYDFIVNTVFGTKHTHYRLIATSTLPHAGLNAFTPMQIPSLDKNTAQRFLRNKIKSLTDKRQKHAEMSFSLNQNKLETIRLFTRANATTLTHFYQAFLHYPNATCYQYLAYILAQYQSQFSLYMQRLSAQQQVIVHALGCHWHASQVARLAKATHIPSKSISAQLTQLEKQKVIEKLPSHNKNHYYRLTNRQFHLWYLFSFANQETQKALKQSTHIMSYLTLEIPFNNKDNQSETLTSDRCRTRLESSRYQSALLMNDEVKTEELTHLFIHALDFVTCIQTTEDRGPINGQDYCESASQYFKAQLPGERLTFLLNAACRGYEQAYLGLISLFELADTPEQLSLAYQINHALCLSAQHQGYDFSSKLLSLYLSQGVMQAECIKLAHALATMDEPEPLTSLLQSFTSIWSGQTDTAKHLLNTYLEKTDLNALEPRAFEWLVEVLILLMSKQEWAYLTQIFDLHAQVETADNTLKGQFLVLYYGLLAFKPKLDNKELNDTFSMPPALKETVLTLIDCVSRTGEKYR